MENLIKITELENQLQGLVKEEIAKLKTMNLIPENLSDDDDEYYDWLYDLPITTQDGQSFYIIKIVGTELGICLLDGLNTEDNRDIQEFTTHDLSLSNKIHLLRCVDDCKKYTTKFSQTL